MPNFRTSGIVISFLRVFSDYKGADDISLRLTLFFSLHVFSDYKGGDVISLHPALFFPSCMSFLTTKERITFRCILHHS